MKPKKLQTLGLTASITLVLHSGLSAADYIWQNAGSNNNWSTAGGDTNWFIDADTTLSPWADGNAALFNSATGENIALTGTIAPLSTAISNNGNWTLSGSGVLGGSGTLSKSGTGTLTLSNSTANTFSGGTTITDGSLNIGTGGTGGNTSTVGALGSGVVSISGGSTLRLWIQNSQPFTYANAISIDNGNLLSEDGINTVSGPITIGASGATLRAKWNTKNLIATGVISGTGALTTARAADGGGNADATVVLTNSNTFSGGTTVNSGVLQLGNAIATDKGGTGVIRGTLTANNGSTVILGFTNALGYNGGQKINTININGATVNHTSNGDNGWGVTYNLTGGILQTTGTGRFAFGGGTAVNILGSPNASNINGTINIREGNAGNVIPFDVVDGTAPVDLQVNASLNQAATGYGITKSGFGTMVMGGNNSYSGNTTVNSGSLVLASGGQLQSSPIVVNSATFRSDSAGKTLASINAGNGSTIGLVAAPSATTNVTGALNLADAGTISIAPILGAGTVAGTYDLITAGSITGTGTPVVSLSSAFGPTRATGTVAVAANKLQFTLTGTGAALVWNNASAGGVATGTWDVNNTANFNNGGSDDVFKAFDSVTFDDSVATGSAKTINLSGNVAPALITVNNSTGNNYTLTASSLGAGQLAGAGSIVKNGTGNLTLGGNLAVTMGGGAITAGGGTFDLGGKTLSAISDLTVSNSGSLTNGTLPVLSAIAFQSGSVTATLNGAAPITKSTAGNLVLSSNSNLTGTTTISEGTLQIGVGTAQGTLGTGAISIASGAVLAYNRSDNAVPGIFNNISGAGTLRFDGTNNGTTNQLSGYGLNGNNSAFSGSIQINNSRLALDNVTDTGTASITTGTNGQIFHTAGILTNPLTVSGLGWGETAGLLGAIRTQGGTLNGPVTLAGNTRISSHGGTGIINGNIGESGGARNLEIGGTSAITNLTLAGTNTYTGTTSVNNAILNLTGSLTSAVTIAAGSTMSGNGSIAGDLAFATGTTSLGVNLGLPGVLTVSGNVTLGGTTTVTLTPSATVAPGGNIPLLTYGTLTGGTGNLALANPTNYRQAVFSTASNQISVNIGSDLVTWTGSGGLTWDIATTSNWTNSVPAASAYYQGDFVTFDDTAGAANGNVNITAALLPASLTIDNNTAVPYAFSGTGSIGGGTSMVKKGNGTLSINIAMPYTGPTSIEGGTVVFDGNGNSNRQSNGNTITVINGSTLRLRGVNAFPTAANSVNVNLTGSTANIVTGTSPATSDLIASHAHLNNISLNGSTIDLTYAGVGLVYNNESFQLNGNVTVTGSSASMIQSTDLPTFQGVALQGSRTFDVPNVTGNDDVDLIVTAELENSDANNGALVKTGDGTLSLEAANSYTAGTTVNAGTLSLGNGTSGSATGTGNVTIASGASLIGNGTLTGTASIAGTIAPSTTLGTLRLGATTITGTYRCDVDGTDYDLIEVTGDLTLTGATLDLDGSGSGFTEDIYPIAKWTGTRTGTFTVVDQPSGYDVVYDDTNKEVQLVRTAGYASWLLDYPGLADTTAGGDPDKDGVANLLEYILGGNPGVSNSSIVPTGGIEGADYVVRFKRSDASESDTTQILQWGTDLDAWNDISINPSPAANVEVEENGAADDDITVTIPRGANTKFFVRLKAND